MPRPGRNPAMRATIMVLRSDAITSGASTKSGTIAASRRRRRIAGPTNLLPEVRAQDVAVRMRGRTMVALLALYCRAASHKRYNSFGFIRSRLALLVRGFSCCWSCGCETFLSLCSDISESKGAVKGHWKTRAMHRAVNTKLFPSLYASRMLVRRRASPNHFIGEVGCVVGCRRLLQQQQNQLQHHLSLSMPCGGSLSSSLSRSPVIARGICSTSSVWKGRRGGASALMPKRTRPIRRRVPGEGKKKKPKVHGAPMSRINRDRQLEEEAKIKLEAMAAIPPEMKAR